MDQRTVTLVPMTEDEFEEFRQWAIPDYARDKVQSGTWDESEALQKSEEHHRELLPAGLSTPGTHFYSIHDPALRSNVGMLWFRLLEDTPGNPAFVYEFYVNPDRRRQGYGLAALRALDDTVKALGASAVLLHVFGHNTAARALYEKAGYGVVDLVMSKAVASSENG